MAYETASKTTVASTTESAKSVGDATEGARSVAEAVKRVADAAVAEVQKVAPVKGGDFVVTGSAGGRFRIQGAGLGTNGTVTVNGKQVVTTGWGSTNIEGTLPAGVKAGDEVVVTVDKDTQFRSRLA